jgi:MraZ protein
MLLTGTYPRTLDDKQRLSLPKRLRDALGQTSNIPLYIAPGTDGSLALYSEEAFSRLGQQLGQGSPARQETRAYNRLFYAQAQAVEVDSQGRIRIPVELLKLAQIDKEIMLLGVRDHMELWDKTRWQEYFDDQQRRYDELAESAFEHSPLPTRRASEEPGGHTLPTQPR